MRIQKLLKKLFLYHFLTPVFIESRILISGIPEEKTLKGNNSRKNSHAHKDINVIIKMMKILILKRALAIIWIKII